MRSRTEQVILRAISGGAGGAGGAGTAILRGVLRCIEPFYATATRARNAMYARGLRRVHRLPRPVVCVGNITTGGTGKTPVVAWLAGRLRDAGHRPAVLLRGYRASSTGISDEQRLLEDALNRNCSARAAAAKWRIPVIAHPDRFAAGSRALAEHPEITAFILDDGFQHRRLARDLDLVLIDATNPFGFGHVLPRGLLREPLSELRRAGAFLLTRVDQVAADRAKWIQQELGRYNPGAPVYRSRHAASGLLDSAGVPRAMQSLAEKRIAAFCGIGNPDSFRRLLESTGAGVVDFIAFPDHHDYIEQDLAAVRAAAARSAAEAIATTEKDWVKLIRLRPSRDANLIPIVRVEVTIGFEQGDEARLLRQVLSIVGQPPGEVVGPGSGAVAVGASAGTAGEPAGRGESMR